MKRAIVHLLLAMCVAGLVRADQTVQSVQQTLKDQGFYYGNVTGDKSAETTAALRRYQIRNGLQVTGEINPETLHSLNESSNSASSAQPTGKSAVTQSTSVRPDETSPIGQNSPSSSPNEPARQLETKPAFASPPPDQSTPRRTSARAAVAEVQRQLITRGYYRGRVDGRYRRRTAVAVSAFQMASGLPPTGRLDTTTINALGLSNENLAYLEPAPRRYETWLPIQKFRHGKWKVKWKKLRREDLEYGLDAREQDRDAWSYGQDRDD
jgi:peptidoglycan hydrolase-like protein with peptidoglycan-binding domain